jgi:hypothetical protein
MNSIIRPCLFLLIAISGLSAAELPKKAPLTRYKSLWDNSPFTTKPQAADPGPLKNPFEDLALKGVAPIAGGYLITLINTKNPAEAVPPIDTDRPSEYQVLKIERDPDKPLGTIVHLQKGSQIGSVTYNEKFTTPKVAAAVPAAAHKGPGQPQIPGQPVQPGQPGEARQPRPRVVPPPPAAAAQPGAAATIPGARGGTSGQRGSQRPSRR